MNPFKSIWSRLARKTIQTPQVAKFVDLAPTSDADPTGIYHDALEFATNSDEVLNIALTGPYGSGKSSVIKSFLLKYPRPWLELSLAAFLPEGEVKGVKVTTPEIERSILQQILYGAGADKLPLSRFKRIEIPKGLFAVLWSTATLIGVSSLWYIFSHQSDVLSGKLFKDSGRHDWFNIASFIAGCVFVWVAILRLYLKSFSLSLKSISLKDIEIAPNATNEDSILNKHLDEIIYFFQATDYDLVVIEDLDRFENPDIFVTLREINALVNANAGIQRKIRFLYALRDDIFVNTDRTKFFEFIVPVIPVINHSNSIDKVLEHAKRIDLNLDRPLARRFIRDVSRYLDDLRLIANIFNEYVIYASNLGLERENALEPIKLLAVLIYKNVIPKDFADLHRQDGALSKVLVRYDEFVRNAEEKIRVELEAIQVELAQSDAQLIRDVSELHSVYAMALIEHIPAQYTHLDTAYGQIALNELSKHQEFEKILAQKSVRATSPYTGHSSGIELRGVEGAVDPTRSYADRKAQMEHKSKEYREVRGRETRELKAALASVRTRRFNEIVRESSTMIEEVFAEVGQHKNLLRFLILEGHLDDTYYQYTSLFHSGRLSRNDNKFLIQIRSFDNPDPDFQLDSISEVIASMRDDDFNRSYVLNRLLVDYLMVNAESYCAQIDGAVEFISTHLENCEEFFQSYYATGTQVARLISALITRRPVFVVKALQGSLAIEHAARIVAYAPKGLDPKKPAGFALARFVSRELGGILDERVAFDFEILKALRVEIEDLSAIGHTDVVAYIASEGLYRLSIGNIRNVMEHVVQFPGLSDLEKRHFSSLREAAYDPLLQLIEANFEVYLRDVLLKLDTNTTEDLSAIVSVLSHDTVSIELRSEFLAMQTTLFPSLEGVPPGFHQVVFTHRKIVATWENCLAFISAEVFNSEVLTAFLQHPDVCRSLSKRVVPRGTSASALRKFLVWNDALPDETYRAYIRMLPMPFNNLADVGLTKKRILIEELKVVFSSENFAKIENDRLRALFIELNFDVYATVRKELSISDVIREELLKSNLALSHKMSIIADIDPDVLSGNPSLAAAIGPVLNECNDAAIESGYAFVQAVIVNSRPDSLQISLLNKMHSKLTAGEVWEVIKRLSPPYSDIIIYGKSPRLDKNPINEELASWLADRRLISSFATFLGDEIKINTFRKEPTAES